MAPGEQLYLGGTPGQRILAHMEGIPSGFKASVIFIQAEISASVRRHTLPCGQGLCSRMAASMVSRAVPGYCTPRYGTL